MATQHAHDHAWVPQWEFGDRLRKVRTDLGYDQKEFAALLELKAPTLSSYEAGRANPRSKDLPALAARLELLTNVPRAWFMGWETENPHQSPDGGAVRPEGLEPPTFTVESRRFAPVTSIFNAPSLRETNPQNEEARRA